MKHTLSNIFLHKSHLQHSLLFLHVLEVGTNLKEQRERYLLIVILKLNIARTDFYWTEVQSFLQLSWREQGPIVKGEKHDNMDIGSC